MATLADLQAQRDRLLEIRGKGVESYQIKDRSMRYRSDADLERALADVERRIAAATAAPVRAVYINGTKGV